MYNSITSFIEDLKKQEDILEIHDFFSPELEMTELYHRVVNHKGKALLFYNNGTSFPVLLNAFGTEERMCKALGVNNLDEVGVEIRKLFQLFASPKETLFSKLKLVPALGRLSAFFPKVKKGRGGCQEVIYRNPDLSILPVLKCWPFDAGSFITLPVVHTKDPVSGIRNIGMYRMQVMSSDTTGMHWHLHKNAARHYQEYKRLGIKMPVSVILGGDPVYTYVATAPLPDQIDEYIAAGFIRKKRVELVKCITNDLEVPADADIVIEGYIDPEEPLVMEGPFGDHTGFYSLDDLYPKFHVSCITHRKNAVYPATVVGIPPQEDGWLAKATERIFLALIQLVMPEVVDMILPEEGCFHNLALIKIKKTYQGQGVKVIQGLWGMGQMMNTKNMICFDESVDLNNTSQIFQALVMNTQIPEDIFCSLGPLDALDHSGISFAFGGKAGMDATIKFPEEKAESVRKTGEIRSMPEFIMSVREPYEGILILFIENTKENKEWLKENGGTLFVYKKVVVWVEKEAGNLTDSDILWWVLSNTDPKRDFRIQNACLLVDGTRKRYSVDGISRRWPEILVMSDSVIQTIDQKWHSTGIQELIPSPSLLYKSLVTSENAEAKL